MAAVKPRRPYNSEGRRAAAQATRLAILEAARVRFVERGYAATTMQDIAQAAGVAWQTIYAVFGRKAAILAGVFDVAIAGDDAAVAIADRATTKQAMASSDPRETLRLFGRFVAGATARAAPVFAVLQQAAASDDEIAALLSKVERQRFEGQTRLARRFAEQGALRQGVDVARARDVIWALASPSTAGVLLTRGWSVEDIESWLVDSIDRLVLRPAPD